MFSSRLIGQILVSWGKATINWETKSCLLGAR